MKKILLLGGSKQQVIAIETAKEMGYKTILCDYTQDNPGQFIADEFYLISTTDKEAVLKLAKEKNIDGILSYASDPAAPTAAYVAEILGLPGNPYESTEILCNKDKFRDFLTVNGFNAPFSSGFSSVDDAKQKLNKYSFPVIIKPVDSSGSKGITVLQTEKGIESALEYAFSYSRCKRVIIEEFVEKKHQYLIGGDIFVINGKISMWGLMNCHRDSNVNSLVPVGKSYPLQLESKDLISVKNTLQSLVDKLNIKNGAMNVELVVDKKGRVWPIDIGPRNGGNMIPDLLKYIFSVDVIEMTIKCAMGEKVEITEECPEVFYATHNLHTEKNGILTDVIFSNKIEKYIVKKCIYKKSGDTVEYFNDSTKALGIVFLKFGSKEEMMEITKNINNLIEINVSC